MNLNCGFLLAQAADSSVRTTFEWGRIQENTDWILPIAVLVALLAFSRWVYRRDAAELGRPRGWFLWLLRAAVFVGLLVMWLEPQWRREREVVRNSRTLLLVDTSLSMELADMAGSADSATGKQSRMDHVIRTLQQSELIAELRRTHDVVINQFNDNLDRDKAITLDKQAGSPGEQDAAGDPAGGNGEEETTAVSDVDFAELLQPDGAATQLGLALRQLITEESSRPLSGIVLMTDGGHNAGLAPETAVELARRNNIPIFPIGLGSDEQPTSVRVSDLAAPARAYPGDDYVVTGYLQSQGLAGQVVEVQLLSRKGDEGGARAPGSGDLKVRQQITLGDDGEVIPVKLTLTSDQPGRQTLVLKVESIEGDRDESDNFREADVEVIDRKNRVLIIASGPMREYRFLRPLLFRDRSTTVDVLLQSAPPGVSQEADKLLDDFPITREEMFEYDCVIAFDPDWQDLALDQIDLLETWVAEQGGGLIVVAGQVHTARTIGGWVEDANMEKIRALYPVEFYRRFSVVAEGMAVSEEPWPLDLTREGLGAQYLWLEDDATAGRRVWSAFEGVYSYCPVRGPKPGAAVLARFADPASGTGDEQRIYFAEQFYGSGRVFYIGSGEMWRLRKLDPAYFEQFYTKLIRHVSQGRLLRGSSRGVLLVGQDRYLVGNTVEVRAQLTDARLDPLRLPSVSLQVVHQASGKVQNVTLQADPSRPGTYAGRFAVLEEGDYRLELPVPESDERLSRRIQVKVPRLEIENPQRNDPLLSNIAEKTNGIYYVGFDEALAPASDKYLVAQLKDQMTTVIQPEAADRQWELTWRRWMMLILCGLVFSEWLIRRLSKLA